MPYSKNNPPQFSKNMPQGAQTIAIDVANAVLKEGKPEEEAIQAAIGAIKNKYKQDENGKWVLKAAYPSVTLTITKASEQKDGTINWLATCSDTNPDNLDEQTTIPLFQDWIERAEKGIQENWLPKPRMPFLGLSHYPDLDGLGEAGPTSNMYIDGQQFKARGYFHKDDNRPLGRLLFSAIRDELSLIKKGEAIEKPIRISAAWYDIAHSHGDMVFNRKSLDEACPMCQKGVGDKKYLKGQLDHFAATRVPINPRTNLALEEKSMTTRKEDALSIIPDEKLVNKLDEEAVKVGKADVLTIKAVTKTVDGEQYPPNDFLVVEDKEKPTTWHLQVRKNGKLDHTLMGAAWAALHGGYHGNKYEGPNKDKAISELKKLYKAEEMETPAEKKEEKADVIKLLSEALNISEDQLKEVIGKAQTSDEPKLEENTESKADYSQAMAIANGEGEPQEGYLPFGGATTIKDAMGYIKANRMLGQSIDRLDVFNTIVTNIYELVTDPLEQVKLIKQATKELNSEVSAIKAAVVDSILIEPINSKEGNIMTDKIERMDYDKDDPTMKMFMNAAKAYMKAMEMEDEEQRKEGIQKAMNGLAKKVERAYKQKSGYDENLPELVATEVQRAMTPLVNQLGLIAAKLGGQEQQTPIPQQKSQAAFQPMVSQSQPQGEMSQIRKMALRKVGLM